MKNTLNGLIGAAGAIVALSCGTTAANADPDTVLHAKSFAELLSPVPNATSVLKASDIQAAAEAQRANEDLKAAEGYYAEHHHHHHFHRGRYHHHHHHHFRHHHHHHHHHFRHHHHHHHHDRF